MDANGPVFSSDLPFTLFNKDASQYSIHNLSENNRKFLWHQFMLDILLTMPSSLTSSKDIIDAAHKIADEEDNNGDIQLKTSDIDNFMNDYTSENVINWYTRDSFFYRVLNKACRMLNTDAMIAFHPIIKDLTIQLKKLNKQQKQDGTLKFPFTVFRGQTKFNIKEFETISANVGGLISMNTFLSTTPSCPFAYSFTAGTDSETTVFFEIGIPDCENMTRFQTFACIEKQSQKPDEKEVLFGMSSVFKIVSVEAWDSHWHVKLELSNYHNDETVEKFIQDSKNYMYRVSGKHRRFFLLQNLLMRNSFSRVKPFMELIKYFLTDFNQIFVFNMYKKGGYMKKLIDMEPALRCCIDTFNHDFIRFDERSIEFVFALLASFLNSYMIQQEECTSEDNYSLESLSCLGGLLLLSGECDKAIQYFQMILKNDKINDNYKLYIHAMVGASYVAKNENERALEYVDGVLQLFESPMKEMMPEWLVTFIKSSTNTQHDLNQALNMSHMSSDKQHSDYDFSEKLRLLNEGYICSQQQKYVDALNHWEEAIEIITNISTPLLILLDGVIYVQMAAAYYGLRNVSNTINIMEKAKQCLESYYPITHRLFASFYFIYAFYLIQNEKPAEAIPYLKKTLDNPYFFNNKSFLGTIYTLLVVAYIYTNDFVSAEEYCLKAMPYSMSANHLSSMIPLLLSSIQELKIMSQYQNGSIIHQLMRTGFALGQQMSSAGVSNANISIQSIDEQTCTIDQLINFADSYHHRQDYANAENYYVKALDKIVHTDSEQLWRIYRKMIRMNTNDNCVDYFTILYSKFDDQNPKDYQLISTIQIILYKIFLSQHQFQLAFEFLICGICMKIKSIYHEIYVVGAKDFSELFNHYIHQKQIIKIIEILTHILVAYSTNWSTFLEHLLIKYFNFNEIYTDLARIIHCTQIDSILEKIQSESIVMFLQKLLNLIRQSIPPSKESMVSLKDQIEQFLQKYNDNNAPLFHLMKIFESLLINDTDSFLINLERFRLNTITFENYKKLLEKLFHSLQEFDENDLLKFLNQFENH